jgi:hypothetical protein
MTSTPEACRNTGPIAAASRVVLAGPSHRLLAALVAVALLTGSAGAQLQPTGPGGSTAPGGLNAHGTRRQSVDSGQPDISGLSDTSLPHSGRLILAGSGFGAEQPGSQVFVDGLPAIVTQWTDTEIHTYVPEQASLGVVPVLIGTPAAWSNAVPLTVTDTEPSGRAQWRFQTDSYVPLQFIALGPDGTIYTSDDVRLYALNPDGGLKWVVDGAGGGRPISFGADGTIYTGGAPGTLVWAINPDGTVRWNLPNTVGLALLAGPNIGPDGNIYAVQDSLGGTGGLGHFSLDPDGNLRFSEVLFFSFVGGNSEITFGDGQWYGSWEFNPSGPATVHVFDMDNGNVLWTGSDIGVSANGYPVLDAFGRLLLAWGQIGVVAVT